jgi:hypothetical protein
LIGWFDRATAVELDFDQFTEADTNGTGAGRPDIGNLRLWVPELPGNVNPQAKS